MAVVIIIYVALIVLMIASWWKIFTKAGQPGWAILVPIYNIIVMLRVAQKPWWWIFLILLVPIVNYVFLIMMIHGISKNFGHGAGMTVGIIFLGIIFIPVLAFGDSKYIGATASTDGQPLDQVK
ncbi:MAG: signal peptidase I [Bacteroidia bacterium]|nr:signal peptidase I [Bacteroidia bacterium]